MEDLIGKQTAPSSFCVFKPVGSDRGAILAIHCKTLTVEELLRR